jgi:tRNA(Ile)-lysidine synthase
VAIEPCPLRAALRRWLVEVPAGAAGVVAVSGGPDSVALLRALVLESTTPLVVAHLNHRLRGVESNTDEAFVRKLHAELAGAGANLLLHCDRMDVRELARGDNLEGAARRIRYEWLTRVARDSGAAWVATGHTADDQAETVLHGLLRGTGLRGLSGIARRRDLAPGIELVRPLLQVRRAEVLDFLARLGQPYCQDSSNLDLQLTRNRLRHELLAMLAQGYNPAVVDVLNRLADQANEVQTFVANQAAALLSAAELPRAGKMVVLDARQLSAAPVVLLRETLRLLWLREGWPLGAMGYEAWQRAAALVRGEDAAMDFPGGLHMRRVGHVIQIV